jgi:hypothetical protein
VQVGRDGGAGIPGPGSPASRPSPGRSTQTRCACSTGRTAPSGSRTPRPDR